MQALVCSLPVGLAPVGLAVAARAVAISPAAARWGTILMRDEDDDGEQSMTPLDVIKSGAGVLGDGLLYGSSIIINIAGALAGLGLLLNLCGWGYRYTLVPPTLVIKPLAEMRSDSNEKRFLAKEFNQLFPELPGDQPR